MSDRALIIGRADDVHVSAVTAELARLTDVDPLLLDGQSLMSDPYSLS